MSSFRLDHLAISAASLEEGVALAEERLGVSLAGGGQHARMGTHNRLLGLGDIYLEVIAIDPAAPAPTHPRWFDLDRFTGPPRLRGWILACEDLTSALKNAPEGAGKILEFERGTYQWQMAVPESGILPMSGGWPALIRWHGAAHPAKALPESHCRLKRLEVAHPDPAALTAALGGRLQDPRIVLVPGTEFALRAEIATPSGTRILG